MMGFGLLWIVFLVVGLFFLAREGSGLQALFGMKQSIGQEKTEASAMDILNLHYASGEITPDQYQSMKQDLNLQ
jgi:uncharacterized membrane protein